MIRQGLRAVREIHALTRGLGNLRVLLASGLVGMLAAGLLNPVMPLYLRSRGLDLPGIGLLYTAGSLLPIFVQPLLGALSDRYGRKGFVVGLSLSTSLLVPVVALLEDPVPLAAVMVLKMLLARSAAPVSNALVADIAPSRQRATIFALLDSLGNLVFVAALLSSAPVVRWLSLTHAFFLAGVLFLVSSLVLLRLQEPPRPQAPSTPAPRAWRLALDGLAAPFAYLRGYPHLAPLFAWQFCFTFALNLFPTYLPLYAVQLGAPESAVGPLVAASWLVFAFVQPFGGRLSDRLPQRGGLIVAGLGGMVVLSAVLGGAAWLPPAFALATLLGAWVLLAVPDGFFRPSAMALVVEQVPSAAERGRFMGALGSCAALAQVVAPVSYGFLAGRAGLGSAFFLSSAAFLVALLAMARVHEPAAAVPTPLPSHSELG